MYKVIADFADLQDGKHKYKAGDAFPRHGYKVTAERLAELSGSSNLMRKPLIEVVKDDSDRAVPVPKELVQQKARRGRPPKTER